MITYSPAKRYSKASSCHNDITVERTNGMYGDLGRSLGAASTWQTLERRRVIPRDRGNLPTREPPLLAGFVIDRTWAIAPAIGFELLPDLHHFVNQPSHIYGPESSVHGNAGEREFAIQ